jgi:hypothetical protein
MKPNEKIIAELARVEYEEKSGKLYIVFEVIDPQSKQDIKDNWTADIDYRIIDKKLVLEEE